MTSVRQLLEHFGNPAVTLTRFEKAQVEALTSVIASWQGRSQDELLSAVEGSKIPVMLTYMSDGWSTDLTKYSHCSLGGQAFRRTGRYRAEFLAEKSIVKAWQESGDLRMLLCVYPPKELAAKSGWHIFSASLSQPFLRTSCPSCICMSVYLQDGLHSASFGRRQSARHDLWYDLCGEEGRDLEVLSQRSRDWTFAMRCILHIASSALKWGLSRFTSEDILDDAHMTLKSLRNSSPALFQKVPVLVLQQVLYEDACAMTLLPGQSFGQLLV